MKAKASPPPPQPTESEAIVAAEREPRSPGTPLAPPSPLPVDVAADLPLPGGRRPAPQPGKLPNPRSPLNP